MSSRNPFLEFKDLRPWNEKSSSNIKYKSKVAASSIDVQNAWNTLARNFKANIFDFLASSSPKLSREKKETLRQRLAIITHVGRVSGLGWKYKIFNS